MISDQYAAGFFDGEGCVYLHRKPRTRGPGWDVRLTAQLSGTDRRPLDEFIVRYGGAVHPAGQPKGNRRQTYQWITASLKARAFLEAVLPYLIIKRKHAELAIAIQAHITANKATFVKGFRGSFVPPEEWMKREQMVAEFRKLRVRAGENRRIGDLLGANEG